jgi:hypothetical protein
MTAIKQDPDDSSKVLESDKSIPAYYTTDGKPPALQNFKVRKK